MHAMLPQDFHYLRLILSHTFCIYQVRFSPGYHLDGVLCTNLNKISVCLVISLIVRRSTDNHITDSFGLKLTLYCYKWSSLRVTQNFQNGGSVFTFDLIRFRFDSKPSKENNAKLPYVRIRLLSLSEDLPHVVNEGVMHPEHGVPGGELDDVHVPTHPVVHAIMMNLGVETYINYRAMSDIQWTVPQWIVSQFIKLLPKRHIVFDLVIRFITNRKYAFFCIFQVRLSADNIILIYWIKIDHVQL